MKRRVYTVRWDKGWKDWVVDIPDADILPTYATKGDAVRHAAGLAKANRPSELIIKTKKGRIGRGSGGRRSYGADPRRHKG